MAAGADHAARDFGPAVDLQAHGERCRVPAAGRQTAKEGLFGQGLVQVKRLRVIGFGKGFDLVGRDLVPRGNEALAHKDVFEIELLAHLTSAASRCREFISATTTLTRNETKESPLRALGSAPI